MPGGSLVKKIILIMFILFIYVILTSSIIDYRSQQRLSDVMIESALRISEARFGHQTSISAMEREKSSAVSDEDLVQRLSGRILLQTQTHGQLWYLHPADGRRYYLGKENEAYRFINRVAHRISPEEYVDYEHFKMQYPLELAGYFIVYEQGGICHIAPVDRRSSCFRSVTEAYEFLKTTALGISNEDIRRLAVGDPFEPPR